MINKKLILATLLSIYIVSLNLEVFAFYQTDEKNFAIQKLINKERSQREQIILENFEILEFRNILPRRLNIVFIAKNINDLPYCTTILEGSDFVLPDSVPQTLNIPEGFELYGWEVFKESTGYIDNKIYPTGYKLKNVDSNMMFWPIYLKSDDPHILAKKNR